MTFDVPTIDITPYFQDPSSAESTKIIADVRKACEDVGFFQLIGHGIPRSLQDAAFKGSAMLFSLPEEEKRLLSRNKSGGASTGGYETMGIQGLEDGKLPDLSESFYITRETRSSAVCGKRLNPWPSESVLPKHVFEKPLLQYHQHVFDLALLVLEVLSRGLPYGPHVFDDFVSGDQVIASLRLLHYPPQTTTDERQLGVGAHTDFGAITLLLQDENPGLQILNSSTGGWVPIPPNRDAYVINVGDMLAMWTRGLYKSGVHRVVNRSLKDRYSMPFFFDGALDCPLLPFDGSRPEGEVLTVRDHLENRMKIAYRRGLKDREIIAASSL